MYIVLAVAVAGVLAGISVGVGVLAAGISIRRY